MKRISSRLFLLSAVTAFLALSHACSNVPERGAEIVGKLTGFATDDSITVFLMHYDGISGGGIMTDTIRNGCFSFRLDSLSGDKHYSIDLMRIRKDSYDILCLGPEIYLEPGAQVKIKGDGRYLYTADISSPVEDQKLRQEFISKMSQEDLKEYQDLFTGRKKDKTAMDSISKRLTEQRLALMETEPFGEYSLSRLSAIASMLSYGYGEYRETVSRLMGRLTEEQKQTRQGKEIASYLKEVPKVSVGDTVPGYEYVDVDGGKHFISELTGKWLLLDFWSLGCGPCIKSSKELVQLSKETSGKNLCLVSISIDGEEGWKEASKEHGVTWTNWRDPLGGAGSIRAYDQGGIPVFVLVNPEGIIEDIQLGYMDGLLHSITDRIN
ncbi:MAG: TlpA family protein disulfide reductase [Bacteroidales bacterium]|nr:TlpA family protein disulfide reductase [Bacteroidales bacterium]